MTQPDITYETLVSEYGIGVDQLKAAVRVVAEDNPDHKAEMSAYAQFGEPCCIVGYALHGLGVPIAQLESWDGDGDGCNVVQLVDPGVVNCTHAELEERAPLIAWLRAVQVSQDIGSTWAYAVRAADEHLPWHEEGTY